jgi:lipopolysaccharide/colanic/teichoic acid biosynthesis glycosyltransferase
MLRRCIDILVSFLALVFAAPILVVISLLVWLLDGRPVLFFQLRAGLCGVPFKMIKFRTMRLNAEQIGGSLTFKSDQRITRLGRILRNYKLDELPQLFNVLRGEMTLIGPRPEVLDWVERYTPEQREVLRVKPGLSDRVQLLFRHEQEHLTSATEYEQLFVIKVMRQIEYLRTRTAGSDLVTALLTLRALLPSQPLDEELRVYAEIKSRTAGVEKERPSGVST